jgi:hypothetical protein
VKKLKWGETPWDNLTREELLREIQRMYSACVSANSALRLASRGETHGFWGTGGTGGEALEKARQVVDETESDFDGEQIYRCFYRYADDLLFDHSKYRIGFGWAVCPVCGIMFGSGGDGSPAVGRTCKSFMPHQECEGVLRPLEWKDLEKAEKAQAKLLRASSPE